LFFYSPLYEYDGCASKWKEEFDDGGFGDGEEDEKAKRAGTVNKATSF